MSKNLYFKLFVLMLSLVVTNSTRLYAQGELQLSTEVQIEAYKKSKPKIAERDGIRASLEALRSNGALQRAISEDTIAIKHVLTCETEANCQTANDWGNNNSFNASGVLTSNGHGGETLYHLFLRQELTPDEDTILIESTKVHEGIKTLDGIQYSTWMLDFDPAGERDEGVNQ